MLKRFTLDGVLMRLYAKGLCEVHHKLKMTYLDLLDLVDWSELEAKRALNVSELDQRDLITCISHVRMAYSALEPEINQRRYVDDN